MRCNFCNKEITKEKGIKIEARRQFVPSMGKGVGFFTNVPERNYHSKCLDTHLKKEVMLIEF